MKGEWVSGGKWKWPWTKKECKRHTYLFELPTYPKGFDMYRPSEWACVDCGLNWQYDPRVFTKQIARNRKLILPWMVS